MIISIFRGTWNGTLMNAKIQPVFTFLHPVLKKLHVAKYTLLEIWGKGSFPVESSQKCQCWHFSRYHPHTFLAISLQPEGLETLKRGRTDILKKGIDCPVLTYFSVSQLFVLYIFSRGRLIKGFAMWKPGKSSQSNFFPVGIQEGLAYENESSIDTRRCKSHSSKASASW